MVIGIEILSIVTDAHNMDSMLYGDGAVAVILSAGSHNTKGLPAHKTRTFTGNEAMLLSIRLSFYPQSGNGLLLK